MTVVFLGIVTSAWALEADYEKSFQQTNALYTQGQVEKALKKYQKLSLIEATPEAFYNLGNAYYKSKQLGRAISAYEKAKLLAPRDEDVRKNLQFVTSLVESKITDKRAWYLQDLENLLSYISLEETEIFALSVGLLTLTWMILLLVFRRSPFSGWIWNSLVFVFALSLVVCGLKYFFVAKQTYGVIIRQDAEVRYGPSRDEKVLFRLSEGLKVRLVEERESWERVYLSSKDAGWIAKDDLEMIKIS